LSPGSLWCEFCWFVKVVEVPALGEAMAGRFVMAMFVLETLMEGGILAVLGAMVERPTIESSLLGVVFEMSEAEALPVMLFLVEAPVVDLSLSPSATVGSLAMYPCSRFLGRLPLHPCLQCVSWGRLRQLFFYRFFVSAAVAFFSWFFCLYCCLC
jgi:hypothetical protein